MKRLVFQILLLICLGSWANAQNSVEQCDFDAIHQNLMLTDPVYKQKTDAFNLLLTQGNSSSSKAGPPYMVPVVVHVMHKGEAVGVGSNISDADINQGIRSLNEKFRKIPGSIGDGNGVDMEMEFALAVRDPNGNCTDGIVRYDMSAHNDYMNFGVKRNSNTGMADATLKALSRWTPTEYYNIYLVYEIDDNNCGSGIQGYAYFASSHGNTVDGMLQLSCKFGEPTNSTLVHEIGHAMNLYHTFEGDGGGGNCPTNTSCMTTGDRCCDTPPHIRYSSHPNYWGAGSSCAYADPNGCGAGTTQDHMHNYMDYSHDVCQNEFTADQKTRSTLAITTTRSSFLEQNGNMSLIPPSAAGVDFSASSSAVCLGTPISFYDESTCIPNTYLNGGWTGITFSWTFDNGVNPPIVSTDQNPTINFVNGGVYNVTLTVTDAFGSHTLTKTAFVFIAPGAPVGACNGGVQNQGNFGYPISRVQFNTIDNSTSSANNGYNDYSCTDITTVDVGQTHTLSIDIQSGSQTGYYAAYIDYDNDGTFAVPAERVMNGNLGGGSANTTRTENVTIPGTTVLGTLLRMRVIYDQFNLSGPCDNLFTGEAEDYGVYINDVGIPVADFTANNTTICEGDVIDFTDISTKAPTQWAWTFTGGLPATSTIQNPTNISYATAGTYPVELIATNANGSDTTVKTTYITVNTCTNPPVADFTANNTTICEGDVIDFTDISTDVPTGWTWAFTGGLPATSTVQNPTNISYATAGTYPVELIATNVNGSDTIVKTTYITVNTCTTPPVADFTANNTTICEGDVIDFTDISTNVPTGWAWAFTGGLPAASTVQNPTNISYATAGTYQVELIATNAHGSDTIVKTTYITVNVCNTVPVADFTANNTTICEGDVIDFTDISTNAPTGWAWAFTGGVPAASTVQNPTNISYATAGTYPVELIATNANGSDTVVKTIYITVNVCGTVPVADFTANNTTICEGDVIDFTDISTNTPTSWSWVFTGGVPATSTVQNPTNISYATAGTYQVELTAVNAAGNDIETKVAYITVNDCSPTADFSASQTTLCEADCITFNDLSTGTPTTYAWSFPGGTPATATGANPGSICYPAIGTYNVTLTVTNQHGTNSVTKSSLIAVNPCDPPIAAITINDADAEICVDNCIDFTFNNDSLGGVPDTLFWTFPGGTPSSYGTTSLTDVITVCWNDTSGNFAASVAATNAYGTSIATQSIGVHLNPIINAGNDISIDIGKDGEISSIITDAGGNIIPTTNGRLRWTPFTYLVSPISQSTPVIQPEDTTVYTVTYTDEYGCVVSDDVVVNVNLVMNVGVPSAFAPGSSFNNILFVKGKIVIESMNFVIYNRYGQQVFETTDVEEGWDGTHKGKELNPGVFVYYLKVTFIDGTQRELKGNVTLVK